MAILSLNPNARELAIEFAQQHPTYGDPDASVDNTKVSKQFQAFLMQKRVPSTRVVLVGPKTIFNRPNKRWKKVSQKNWIHTVVVVGGIVFDFTYRQFDPMAEYPRVTTLSETKQEWSTFMVSKN